MNGLNNVEIMNFQSEIYKSKALSKLHKNICNRLGFVSDSIRQYQRKCVYKHNPKIIIYYLCELCEQVDTKKIICPIEG